MSIDIAKATAKMTFLITEATIHERSAGKLRDLADDEEREASRLTREAHRINELITAEVEHRAMDEFDLPEGEDNHQ